MNAIAPTRTDRLAKALAHPLRIQILRVLNERVASPVQISTELGLPLPNVAYHTKILAEHGCIELVRTRPRRGATEHFYRAVEKPFLNDEQWGLVPVGLRSQLMGQAAAEIFNHVREAVSNGGFDDPEVHVSWTRLTLDEEGWDEVVSLLAQTLDTLSEIEAASAGRLVNKPPEDRISGSSEVAMLHFRRTPTD